MSPVPLDLGVTDDPWVRQLWELNALGAKTVRALVEHFPHPEAFFSKPWKRIARKIHFNTPAALEALRGYRATPSKVRPPHFPFISFRSPQFPQGFKELYDPPCGFYFLGDMACLGQPRPRLAVVGTRYASRYALEATTQLISELADFEPMVVSGMARGIDGRAHEAALSEGLQTAAILGTGLDRIYPYEHRRLFARIQAQGFVLSELPPNTDRKSTRLNSSHSDRSRMPSSA